MQICRLCKNKTKEFLNLGETPLPEEFRTVNELTKPVKKYPLSLVFCMKCKHVQLGHKMDAEIIYKQNYFYDYSITKTGQKHWRELAENIFKTYQLIASDLIVDIGSNTGVLLTEFKKLGTRILGVDPSPRPVKLARQRGIQTINKFFSAKIARKIYEEFGKAKVITCTNTFDHVRDPEDVVSGIAMLLQNDGMCTIEMPYFAVFLKHLSHVVYHQQIDYIMLNPLVKFFNKYRLDIFDAQEIPFHGGSIRILICFQNAKPPGLAKRSGAGKSQRLKTLLKKEEQLFENYEEKLALFAKKIYKQRDDLTNLLAKLKKQGKKITAIGASAKGISLLNYCDIGSGTINCISEKSRLKIGRFTPSGIPIVSDIQMVSRKPDYTIILAWNFIDEVIKNILKKNKFYGKFIIPVPSIEIV